MKIGQYSFFSLFNLTRQMLILGEGHSGLLWVISAVINQLHHLLPGKRFPVGFQLQHLRVFSLPLPERVSSKQTGFLPQARINDPDEDSG